MYSRIYACIDDALKIYVDEYSDTGKEQYVYFSRNMCVSRSLRNPDYFTRKLCILNEIEAQEKGFGFLKKKYIEEASRIDDFLNKNLNKYSFLVEPEVLAGVQNIHEQSIKLQNELAAMNPETLAEEKLDSFLEYIKMLVYYLFDTKHAIETCADKIQTKEEYQLEKQIKFKQYKQKLKDIKEE